jgi:hypothetical protein
MASDRPIAKLMAAGGEVAFHSKCFRRAIA